MTQRLVRTEVSLLTTLEVPDLFEVVRVSDEISTDGIVFGPALAEVRES